MAKATRSSDVGSSAKAVLETVLANPVPRVLYDAGEIKGVFGKKAAASSKLAQHCVDQGWLEATGAFAEVPKGKPTKKGVQPTERVELYRLTAKGLAALLEGPDATEVLGRMSRAVETIALNSAGAKQSAEQQVSRLVTEFQKQCQELGGQVTQAADQFRKQCGELQQQMQTKLTDVRSQLSDGSTGGDLGPMQRALKELADKMKPIDIDEIARKLASTPTGSTAKPTPTPTTTPAPTPAPAPAPAESWLDEVVRFVQEIKSRNPLASITFPQVYEHVQQKCGALTLGQYHDGLRKLYDQKRVKLDAFTQALFTLQDRRTAMYLNGEVMYYVEPPR